MRKLAIIAIALLLAAAPAFALADNSTLRVQGTAILSIAPDQAVLSVGYSGEDADAATAQRQAADITAAVVRAVQSAGVEEDDIMTGYMNTYPVYNYGEETPTLRGYRVEHMLSITVKQLDIVGNVLDAALGAGANQANSITFISSQEKEAYLQALALAVDDAASKADALAIAAGVWLGSLEQINEISASYSPNARYSMDVKYEGAMAGSSLGSSLITGDLQVSASVELIYAIR